MPKPAIACRPAQTICLHSQDGFFESPFVRLACDELDHLRPDALVYLVAGKVSATQQPFSTLGLGEPKSIDISIPPPAPATTPGQAPQRR